jgi:hypothetical protein
MLPVYIFSIAFYCLFDKKDIQTSISFLKRTHLPCTYPTGLTIYVPDAMIAMGGNPFRGPLEGVGPENRDFIGL